MGDRRGGLGGTPRGPPERDMRTGGPNTGQEGPQRAPGVSKRGTSESPEDRAGLPKLGPRRPQRPTRRSKKSPRGVPRGLRGAKIVHPPRKTYIFSTFAACALTRPTQVEAA
eukprot:3062068-Pyramimonas_sp.AAC.1